MSPKSRVVWQAWPSWLAPVAGIFSVPRLIAELSDVLPLLPGDVIFTGTPAGVGIARQPARFLRAGQVLESWVEGIGTIRNRCV